MPNITYIAVLAGSAILALGITVVSRKPTVPPPSLDQRWKDATARTVPYDIGPRIVTVKTIPIRPAPEEIKNNDELPQQQQVEEEQPVIRSPQKRIVERRQSDICSAHHMRKVYVGRYKWRCKR